MRTLHIGGRTVAIGGQVTGVAEWHDADSTHSWDMAEAIVVEGRTTLVPDPHGGRPLRRMPGAFPLLGADLHTYGPLPGPLYIESSERFSGHAAVRCDPFLVEGSLFHLYAGLSPNVGADDATGPEDEANYFDAPDGYAQPYWVAVLARIGSPDDPEGTDDDPAGVWDATHGGIGTGPTIGRKIVGLGNPHWQVSNFGPNLVLVTVPHTALPTETVVLICCVNGASSFLEVTWRDVGGIINTQRVSGTLLGWNYLEAFLGWVHGAYLAKAAIGLDVPDEDNLDFIRQLGASLIPTPAVLADEP